MPPASLNHRDPTAGATPASRPASSRVRPAPIDSQNRRRSSRFATPGRPGDRSGALNALLEPRFRFASATSIIEALRRPVETAQFITIPSVGPIIALSFATAVEDPSRFRRSRDVAAYFGLISKRWQSGSSIDIRGRISKADDPDVRRAFYEAASAMLTRFKGTDALKTWGLKLAKTKCHPKARIAVARKLAVVMHALWRNGSDYVGDPDTKLEDVAAWRAAKTRRLSAATS